EISVGRGNSNDIIVKDQEIAKRHARIIVNYQGQVEIKELGSDYGIFVNGEKLGFRTSRLLIRDDVISMGRSEFQYLPTGEYKNHFKSINDQNDHMAGDYALKELATLIQNNNVRSEDIFARYGGDEFTLLLKDTNKMLAFEIAEKIRDSVETHSFIYNKIKLSVTLSIGVSEMNSSVKTCNDLLLHADNASKKAKECGRNRIIIWSDEPNSTLENENRLSESPNKSTENGNNNYKELFCTSSSAMSDSFSPTVDASFSSSFSSTMDDEIGITMVKSDLENKRTECYMYFPRKETLDFIRTKLEEYDFHMGTNCHFTVKNGALILRKDESKLNILRIIETRDNDTHCLYIKERAEFDLLQLKYEKGFKFGTDGSIGNASYKAFEIDINKIEFSDPGFVREEKEYKC
ncbi:439_t:CDS:2, partial [Dentiscutata heterogama]